jgi:hypothetical protein
MTLFTETLQRELNALRAFVASQCSEDGIVAQELREVILKLEAILKSRKNSDATLKVKTNGDNSMVVVTKIGLQSTISDLMANVEVLYNSIF